MQFSFPALVVGTLMLQNQLMFLGSSNRHILTRQLLSAMCQDPTLRIGILSFQIKTMNKTIHFSSSLGNHELLIRL